MILNKRQLLLGVAASALIKADRTQGVAEGPNISASGLPAGVTLRAIDGEMLTSSTTMTNSYYSRNGFSNAVTMGWDDPGFFPIGPFESVYDPKYLYFGQADVGAAATVAALKWNMFFNCDAMDETQAALNNVSYMPNAGGSALTGRFGAPAVGIMTQDEPSNSLEVSTPIVSTPNNIQDHRFWYTNFRGQLLHDAEYSAGQVASAMVLSELSAPPLQTSWLQTYGTSGKGKFNRHIDIASVDIYWMSAAVDPSWSGYLLAYPGGAGPRIYNLKANMTVAQAQRGTNYGDAIDLIRGFQAARFPAPIVGLIETGGPFAAQSLSCLTVPPLFNWGCWAMIIHGARSICLFDHTGTTDKPQEWWAAYAMQVAQSNPARLPGHFYANPLPGQSVSMLAQVKTTCGLIYALAPVINSPFAIGYARVSPAGYSYPIPLINIQDGIDICVHWYEGGGTLPNGFYIFATPRNAATDTNIRAEFNVASGSAVSVIGEDRTIPISGGIFSDVFANGYTVHIYHVS